jgi:Fe-S-cluster containining protein
MGYLSSLDKVVKIYFTAIARKPFTFEGETFEPKPLTISPLIFRGYTCPPMCGGCCSRPYSLEWLPTEKRPSAKVYGKERLANIRKYTVDINGIDIPMFGDDQSDSAKFAEVPGTCKHLRKSDGRCGIHGPHPFHCDFELIRFKQHTDHNVVNQQLFGRGWNFTRVTGEKRALCTMTDPDAKTVEDLLRRLRRLKQWVEHFGIESHIDTIIAWAEKGPYDTPLNLYPDGWTGPVREARSQPRAEKRLGTVPRNMTKGARRRRGLEAFVKPFF